MAGVVSAWLMGRIGFEALLGLLVFGAVWENDRGPGPDEPMPPAWWKALFDFMSRKGPATSQDFVRRPRPPLLPLPLMDFGPMATQSPPPVSPLKRTDREKLIKAMEEEFAKRFSEVLRKEAPFKEKLIDLGPGFRLSSPTLRFEMQAPARPAARPRDMEEAYTETLLRDLHEQWPIQTFSGTERIYDSPPDFRTEGESGGASARPELAGRLP